MSACIRIEALDENTIRLVVTIPRQPDLPPGRELNGGCPAAETSTPSERSPSDEFDWELADLLPP